MATRTEHQTLADETVTRTDLAFIGDDRADIDQQMFLPQKTAQQNADYFVKTLDPFSIMMCTDLFTPESEKEISRLYRQPTLSS